MSEPWTLLSAELESLLRREVKDFVNETRPELQEFIADRARDMAREKWISIHGNADDRLIAESNLNHLRAQIAGEIARLDLAVTMRAKDLLSKVFDTALSVLIKLGPALLGI